jgi:hypothetical protein
MEYFVLQTSLMKFNPHPSSIAKSLALLGLPVTKHLPRLYFLLVLNMPSSKGSDGKGGKVMQLVSRIRSPKKKSPSPTKSPERHGPAGKEGTKASNGNSSEESKKSFFNGVVSTVRATRSSILPVRSLSKLNPVNAPIKVKPFQESRSSPVSPPDATHAPDLRSPKLARVDYRRGSKSNGYPGAMGPVPSHSAQSPGALDGAAVRISMERGVGTNFPSPKPLGNVSTPGSTIPTNGTNLSGHSSLSFLLGQTKENRETVLIPLRQLVQPIQSEVAYLGEVCSFFKLSRFIPVFCTAVNKMICISTS